MFEGVPIAKKFIVGLGNPGPAYEKTRHNLGFLAVDAYARAAGFGRAKKRFQALCREMRVGDHSVMLVKPQTYMNLSGHSVRDLLAHDRVEDAAETVAAESPSEGADAVSEEGRAGEDARDLTDALLVIYDDLDLPFGRLRFRGRGSSGGHRGLGSIIGELRTERFSRLKVGIGRDDEQEAEDYVLAPLSGEREEQLMEAARVAAETIPAWLEEGVVACATRYNGGRD